MPIWYCRVAAAGPPLERCEGRGHDRCGMRYGPGEYTLSRDGITLPGVGTIAVPGLMPGFMSRYATVIVYQDEDGWAAEFEGERDAS